MKERLRQVLEYFGINQTEFASRTGISKATLSHILSAGGRGGNLSDPTIEKIVTAFPSLNRDWIARGNGSMINSDLTNEPNLFTNIERSLQSSISKNQHIRHKQEEKHQQIVPNVNNSVNHQVNQDSSANESRNETLNVSDSFVAYPTENPIYSQDANNIKSIPQKRKITRIVIFYDDNSFTEHLPQ